MAKHENILITYFSFSLFLYIYRKELLEQKAQFNVQLEDAHKNVNNLQTKISEMQIKIDKLEQELSAKTWNVESKFMLASYKAFWP